MLEVGVVGASGYGGGELVRLLTRHPKVKLTRAISETYAGKPITAAFPGLSRQTALRFESYGDGSGIAQCEVVFLAQENGKAMQTAPHLLESGCKIVDLSADFRFSDTVIYETWYKMPHLTPQWNQEAVYGLPELYRDSVQEARLVGNPGCYPTATILGLAPLLAKDMVEIRNLIVDAKSGTSGAGRAKFGLDNHFPEINESVSAYKIAGTHRHTPEIEQALSRLSAQEIKITFTPHLMPMTRGILATCYANLLEPITTPNLSRIYEDFYTNSPFVVVLEEGLPATKHTVGSNRCHIGVAVDPRTNRVTIVSAIDNLIKGAAGQAIQNMNLMCDFEETAGLDDIGGMWP